MNINNDNPTIEVRKFHPTLSQKFDLKKTKLLNPHTYTIRQNLEIILQ